MHFEHLIYEKLDGEISQEMPVLQIRFLSFISMGYPERWATVRQQQETARWRRSTTWYGAWHSADYGFHPRELELAKYSERTDWKRGPFDRLFDRTDAIYFMNSAGKKLHSPAIIGEILIEATLYGRLYNWFILELAGFSHATKEDGIPFATIYSDLQPAAFAWFFEFSVFNVPGEL